VLGRTRYEPYGATAAGTNPTGIGFTGHVNDADTGLVYMQQRYYEPIAGRFLSVDPVTTDANGGSFNRYLYANGNPYLYVDPDGRQSLSDFRYFGSGSVLPGAPEICVIGVNCEQDRSRALVRQYLFSQLSDKGDHGSPESNDQGLSNTHGDQIVGQGLKVAVDLLPGSAAAGCLVAGGCGFAASTLAAIDLVPGAGKATALSVRAGVALREVVEFLGPRARVITNKSGDKVFMSADELRRVRFDIRNSGGDKAHMHLEVRRTVDSRFRDYLKDYHRIYPGQ
jgi:RHS repeat-associated protein